MDILDTQREDIKEDTIYLTISQRLLSQAKSEFKDCDTKEKLVAYLKETMNVKEYYQMQKDIYLYQYAELVRHTQEMRAKVEEVKAIVEILDSIQREVTHRIMKF